MFDAHVTVICRTASAMQCVISMPERFYSGPAPDSSPSLLLPHTPAYQPTHGHRRAERCLVHKGFKPVRPTFKAVMRRTRAISSSPRV